MTHILTKAMVPLRLIIRIWNESKCSNKSMEVINNDFYKLLLSQTSEIYEMGVVFLSEIVLAM